MSIGRCGRYFSLLVIALCGLLPAIGFSRGADVTFRGAVTRVQQSDAQHGIAHVRLEQVDLPVVINAETDIEDAGDAAALSGLAVGDFVKISGYYSSVGIVAREIQILDDKSGDFRLRGKVSAVVGTQGGVSVKVNGQSVLLDDDSRITRRGHEDRLSPADLPVGTDVDVRGSNRDGQMVARALLVGTRQEDSTRVRFEGVVASTPGSSLMIDTEGGGLAVVLLSSSTEIRGILTQGTRVEVKGNLNERLEVEAQIIRVENAGDDKGNDSGGDDKGTDPGADDKGNDAPVLVSKAIMLTATAAGAGSRGSAEVEFEMESGKVSQRLTVEVEDAMPKADFHIIATLSSSEVVDLGVLSTDSKGKAKTRLSLDASGSPLPAGKDVRDIARIQITLNGSVILQGSF